MAKFESELIALINKHSKEKESNTPDYVLAKYLCSCLDAFNAAIKGREIWHKFYPKSEAVSTDLIADIKAEQRELRKRRGQDV